MSPHMDNAEGTPDSSTLAARWIWFSRWPPIVKLLPPLAILVLNASRLPKAYPAAKPVLLVVDCLFLAWVAADIFANFIFRRSSGATAGRFGFLELLAVMLLVGMTIGLLYH